MRNDDVDLIVREIKQLRQAVLNLQTGVSLLQLGQVQMSKAMDDITNATLRVTSTVESAATAFKALAQQISDQATDPAAIEKLADTLNANADRLAAAIVVNTPASTPESVAVAAAPAPADNSAPVS